jgi:hypothetical protein
MKHTRNTQYTPKSSPELRTPKQPPDPLQGGINNLTFLATQQTRQKSTRRPPTHQIRHQHTNTKKEEEENTDPTTRKQKTQNSGQPRKWKTEKREQGNANMNPEKKTKQIHGQPNSPERRTAGCRRND